MSGPSSSGEPADVPASNRESRTTSAILLGERLDHRRLAVAAGGMTDPIQLARPDGLIAFAFRWGVDVLVGATPDQQAGLRAEPHELLSRPLDRPADETARIQSGAAEDSVDVGGIVHLKDFSIPRLEIAIVVFIGMELLTALYAVFFR